MKIRGKSDSKKCAINNINYKIGILLEEYSYLKFYSKRKSDFKLTLLYQCPEILIQKQNEELKQNYKKILKKGNKSGRKPKIKQE